MAIFESVVWFYPVYGEPLIARIQFGQRAMIAFSYFFFTRLADVHSRAASGTLALIVFLIGSVLASAGNSISAHAAAMVLSTVGSFGLSILPFLFVSDYTSLRWRGLALGGVLFAPLISVWASPPIHERLESNWAFGIYGILMFAICTPALVALQLVSSRHQEEIPEKHTQFISKFKNGFVRMDPIGLLISTIGLGLITYNTDVWWDAEITDPEEGRPKRVAMLIIGLILAVPVFTLWELCFAPFPLMPRWVFKRRGVLFAAATMFCCRTSSTLPILVNVYPSEPEESVTLFNYFYNASFMSNAILAPIFGCLFLLTRRYKPYLLLGEVMLILSCGLGVHSVRVRYFSDNYPSTGLLFAIQILDGVGSAAIDLGTMVGSQASVPHSDLATVVGVVNAIPMLASVLGPTSVTISIRSLPSFHRITVILYSLATGFAILALIFSLFMPNYLLGDTHNATDKCEDDSLVNAPIDSETAHSSVGNK